MPSVEMSNSKGEMTARLPNLSALTIGTRAPASTGVPDELPLPPPEVYLSEEDSVSIPIPNVRRVDLYATQEMPPELLIRMLGDLASAEMVLDAALTLVRKRKRDESAFEFPWGFPYPTGASQVAEIDTNGTTFQLYELVAERRRTLYNRLVDAINVLLSAAKRIHELSPRELKLLVEGGAGPLEWEWDSTLLRFEITPQTEQPYTDWWPSMRTFVDETSLVAYKLKRYYTVVPFQFLEQRDQVVLQHWLAIGSGVQREYALNCYLLDMVINFFEAVDDIDYAFNGVHTSWTPQLLHALQRTSVVVEGASRQWALGNIYEASAQMLFGQKDEGLHELDDDRVLLEHIPMAGPFDHGSYFLEVTPDGHLDPSGNPENWRASLAHQRIQHVEWWLREAEARRLRQQEIEEQFLQEMAVFDLENPVQARLAVEKARKVAISEWEAAHEVALRWLAKHHELVQRVKHEERERVAAEQAAHDAAVMENWPEFSPMRGSGA